MTTDGAGAPRATAPVHLRTVDLVLVGATVAAMVAAGVLRAIAAMDGLHLRNAPLRYSTAPPPDIDAVGLANWASGAAGIGVLLLATTLVVVAVGPWGRSFAVVVGISAVAISLGAVALAVAASHAVDPETAFRLGTWRTGLAAIAGACLPAVFAAAVRTSAARQRR